MPRSAPSAHRQHDRYERSAYPGGDFDAAPKMQQILVAARQLAAVAQVISQVNGERAENRNVDYQQFMTASAACQDLKCAADLANRMQAEALFLKNNELQMRALENSLRAEEFELEQRQRELLVQMNRRSRDLGPVMHR